MIFLQDFIILFGCKGLIYMVTDAMKALVTKWELKTIAIIHPLSKKNKHVIRWGKCKKNLNQLRINNVFTSSHILQLLLKKIGCKT